MAPTELETLLQALRERDIDLGADDVAWAFEDKTAKEGASAWVNQYLQPSTSTRGILRVRAYARAICLSVG